MQRRRAAAAALAERAGADCLLACGENRSGSAVGWLTGWPVTAEAVALLQDGQPGALFIQYHNHVPLARRIAAEFDVQWGGPATVDALEAQLDARRARKIAVIGVLGAAKQRRLARRFELVDLNAAYAELRLVKSAEEIDWTRIGAWLSDLAIDALREQARPGMDERGLWALCEQAYVREGGSTWIHYFGATSMAAPDCCVPAQYPSTRRLAQGDVLFCEISAQFWEYPGQVLRSFTLGAPPTALYRDLYGAAEAALDAMLGVVKGGASAAQLVAASCAIEQAGFTTCDDLVHGFVGGYLPPVLGSASRPAGPLPDFTLQPGMMLVLQPNVVTPDARAGVQVGELVVVTEAGCERLHDAPREFFRL
ncbi:MAG TPA: M24 family metallopeptidase [Burkholderiales bacterium]|nr:M24 family metallopeptidase [Burkholderiales bacterium]